MGVLMKKINYIIVFAIYFFIGCAGMEARPAQDLEKIVEMPGFTKNQIFDQTKIYIAENFKSAKAVLEYENKETGTIIGNGIIKFPTAGGMESLALNDWKTAFKMRVDIKEERFRCTFSNIGIEWPATYGRYGGPAGGRSIFYGQEFERISSSLLSIPSSIENSIKRSNTKDNW